MTLNVNSLLCRQTELCVLIVTKGMRLESRDFRYKVALYLSYVHIKFEEEIIVTKLKGNPFEFQ